MSYKDTTFKSFFYRFVSTFLIATVYFFNSNINSNTRAYGKGVRGRDGLLALLQFALCSLQLCKLQSTKLGGRTSRSSLRFELRSKGHGTPFFCFAQDFCFARQLEQALLLSLIAKSPYLRMNGKRELTSNW